MKVARIISALPVLALFGWGCSQDSTTSPRGIASDLTSTASDPGTIEYIADPPRVAVSPDMVLPNGLPYCGTGSATLICYAPSFIRAAYNFPPSSTLDGTGQTIVIVDAFGSPTIATDLAVFDAVFKIPAPPSFTILCGDGGCPTYNPRNHHGELGWTVETSLDVEYAHAMAPGANIVLVVAATNSGNAINAAETQAIARYPGSVMSQSFGTPEIVVRGDRTQIMQAHLNYQAAQAAGITVLASAGDFGATNGFAVANAQFPASDPLVTAVGGTQGNPYIAPGTTPQSCAANATCSSGLAMFMGPCDNSKSGFLRSPCTPVGYGGEQVWNEAVFAPGATTGGAPSLIFPVPAFQNGLGLGSRTVPDVSYNAAVQGGVLVANSTIAGFPAFFLIGGTSAGSPQWAAIIALANQLAGHSLGYLNPAIYTLAQSTPRDFHDITVGNNQMPGTPVGFSAKAGWDDATGWGTPNVSCFLADLTGKAVATCK